MGQPASIVLSTTSPLTDWVSDIAEMHTKFGVNPVIHALEPEKLRAFLKFRLDFLKEELIEAYEAAGFSVLIQVLKTEEPLAINPAEDIVDAMVDLCVVAIGTLNAFDVDAYEAWNRVHSKNMQKEPGINANRQNAFGLPDLIKPKNWEPPSHKDNIGLLAKIF